MTPHARLPRGLWILLSFMLATRSWAAFPEKYESISNRYGVPPALTYAIALTESQCVLGHGQHRPWPWTANVRGKPIYAQDKAHLVSILNQEIQHGRSSFAVGLMQIYWTHHKRKFNSVDEALDPAINIEAGVAYLRDLKDKYGSFEAAVGKYHTGENGPIARQRWYAEQVKKNLRLALKEFNPAPPLIASGSFSNTSSR